MLQFQSGPENPLGEQQNTHPTISSLRFSLSLRRKQRLMRRGRNKRDSGPAALKSVWSVSAHDKQDEGRRVIYKGLGVGGWGAVGEGECGKGRRGGGEVRP